jgi:2-polyprenyl-3-methyl-5-hydroxy-6-metoxy-1,4-benzoquinol methylase
MDARTLTLVEKCPLCQRPTNGSGPFAVVNGWRYVKCGGCSLVFLNPRPTPEVLSAYYNEIYDYDPHVYRNSVEEQKEWLLQLIERFRPAPAGRLLEIGCSYGFFLDAARREGWDVDGIELSDRAASFARKELGLSVVGATISELCEEQPLPYDAVVAWHVIEHLTDPRKFLEQIAALVRPGGILALRTPNIESAVAKLAGRAWEWMSPPDHIYLFSARTLCRLLRACGFEILLIETRRGNASNTWFESLRSRYVLTMLTKPSGEVPLMGAPQPRRFANQPWYRVARSVIEVASKPLDWFVSPWLARFGREAELIVVAKKSLPQSDSRSLQLSGTALGR